MIDHLLLQSGEALLLQDGGFILLQSASDEVQVAVKTGTGGIDPGGKGKRRVSVKPVPFLGKGKKPKTKIDERVEETREIHAEIAGELARELRGELEVRPISEMSLSDIDREIGVLLRKVQRTQEEELLLLLLMVS